MASTMMQRLRAGWTRVATTRRRRRLANHAVTRMRAWHDKATTVSPYGIPWKGHCAHSVAAGYGKQASGWDAIDGWRHTPEQYRHHGRNKARPPRGALCYWAGGSGGYGHVAISNGRGKVWGVDLPVDGRIGLVPVGEVHQRWGLTYLGWIWATDVAGWDL